MGELTVSLSSSNPSSYPIHRDIILYNYYPFPPFINIPYSRTSFHLLSHYLSLTSQACGTLLYREEGVGSRSLVGECIYFPMIGGTAWLTLFSVIIVFVSSFVTCLLFCLPGSVMIHAVTYGMSLQTLPLGILLRDETAYCPLSCRNKGAGADRAPDLGDDGGRGTRELREGSGWVIDVPMRVLQGVEGGTLVSRQRDTVLYP